MAKQVRFEHGQSMFAEHPINMEIRKMLKGHGDKYVATFDSLSTEIASVFNKLATIKSPFGDDNTLTKYLQIETRTNDRPKITTLIEKAQRAEFWRTETKKNPNPGRNRKEHKTDDYVDSDPEGTGALPEGLRHKTNNLKFNTNAAKRVKDGQPQPAKFARLAINNIRQ